MILTRITFAKRLLLGFLICSLFGTSLFLASCSGTNDATEDEHQTEWMSEGSITGYDMRRCASPCCGGWFIDIEGKEYRFLAFPEGSDPELQVYRSEEFPIPVKLNWTSASTDQNCTENLIAIQAIVRGS